MINGINVFNYTILITCYKSIISISFISNVLQAASKQLRMLAFVNPGRFMEDFHPEQSAREKRKVNRKAYKESLVANYPQT